MKAEIITSGTELLLGEVTDTNTPYLARELAKIGVNVYLHTTVGDNPLRLLDAIKLAEDRADVVIVSGGLGPTQDDITKKILAEHLDVELVLDEESFKKASVRHDSKEISTGNYRQALILEGSTPLKNEIGMAAGIFTEHDDHLYALLPGVPNEFEYMVSNYLLPKLSEYVLDDNVLRSRNLNFYGMSEASIAENLNDIIENQTNPTVAIYAKSGIIDIRLTASAAKEEESERLLDQMETEIIDRIGEHFVGYHKTKIQDVIFEELTSTKQTLSLIEIQTNGEVMAGWSENSSSHQAFKGGLYFSNVKSAQNYLEMDGEGEEEKSFAEQNEEFATRIKETMQTNYVVSVSSWGKIKTEYTSIPEVLYISIIQPKGEILTKEVSFTRRMYFADWVVNLKVSDFVRRVLLSLPQLEDNQY